MTESIRNRILLVEDQAILAMAEKIQLEKYGYAVRTVTTGEDAVEAINASSDIDLILMDINLGSGIDGTQAAEIILKDHDIPIVFLSSHTEPEVVEKTEKITSYGYVVKNSSVTVLDASMKMAFRLYAAHMELKRRKEDLNTALRKYEQTAEELVEKNEELDRYFSSSLDLLCIANTDGEFVRLNPEWEKVLGYSVTELEGRLFLDFIHPEDRDATSQAVAKLDAGDDVTSFENRLRARDGSYRWVEWRSRPIGSEIYAAARDITDRKRAESEIKEREEYLRITLNSIGDAVISTDIEGTIVQMNPVAENLCGWGTQDAKGKPLEEVFHIVHADTGEKVKNPVARVLETGNTIGLANHTMLISRDGTEYQIGDSAAPIRDDTGHIAGVVLVFRDVTEEYRKNRHIKESKEFLDAVFLSIQDGISVSDADLSIKYANPVMERWYASNLPLFGKKCYAAYRNRTTPCVPCPSLRCIKTGRTEMEIIEVEADLHSPVQCLEVFSYPLIDTETGKVKGVIEFVRDISERRRVEQELEKSEEKYSSLFNQAVGAIYLHDFEGNITDVNEAACEQTGYSKSELLQLSVFDVHVTGNDTINLSKDETKRVWKQSKVGERHSFAAEHKRKDGTIFPVRLSTGAIRYGNDIVVMAIVEDVTDHKETANLIKKYASRLELTMEAANMAWWEMYVETGNVDFSSKKTEMLGYSSDQFHHYEDFTKLVHPDDYEPMMTSMRALLHGPEDKYDVEYRIKAQSGEYRWFRDIGTVTQRTGEGKPLKVSGIVIHVTEQKIWKETLEDERRRLAAIIEGTNVGTWEWNVQTGTTIFNERWASIIGYTLEEISPVSIETWQRFTNAEDLERSEQLLRAHFNGDTEMYEIEVQMRHKDGHWVWVLDRGKVATWTEDGKPEWVYGTHQEVTKRKQAEKVIQKQLTEKETLLREIHHRVKNNIATIESFLSLQIGDSDSAEVKTALQDAISRVQSIRVLYDKLLLSKELDEISIKDYAEGLIDSLVMVFDPEKNITVETRIADIEVASKKAVSIGIIINELLTNVFKYAFNNRDNGLASVSIDKEESTVTLIIQDNGVGIDERARENKSPGFGLTIVKMLVEQLGGTYSVSNENGTRSVVQFAL